VEVIEVVIVVVVVEIEVEIEVATLEEGKQMLLFLS
jgi:hypothetical protein